MLRTSMEFPFGACWLIYEWLQSLALLPSRCLWRKSQNSIYSFCFVSFHFISFASPFLMLFQLLLLLKLLECGLFKFPYRIVFGHFRSLSLFSFHSYKLAHDRISSVESLSFHCRQVEKCVKFGKGHHSSFLTHKMWIEWWRWTTAIWFVEWWSVECICSSSSSNNKITNCQVSLSGQSLVLYFKLNT